MSLSLLQKTNTKGIMRALNVPELISYFEKEQMTKEAEKVKNMVVVKSEGHEFVEKDSVASILTLPEYHDLCSKIRTYLINK